MEEKPIRSQAGRPMSYGYMLWALDDDTLYTAATIADLNIKRDSEPREHEKLKSALRMAANRHFFNEQVDGRIRVRGRLFNAWLGRTWKIIVPPEDRRRQYDPNLIFQLHGRPLDPEGGFLRIMAEGVSLGFDPKTPLLGDGPIAQIAPMPHPQTPLYQLPLPDEDHTPEISTPQSKTVQPKPPTIPITPAQPPVERSQPQTRPEPLRLKTKPLPIRVLRLPALVCVVLLCAAWLARKQDMGPIPPSGFRIAYLACPDRELEPLVGEMVSVGFSATRTFLPIAVENRAQQLGRLCEPPSGETLKALAEDLQADLLIWGRVSNTDGRYQWRGRIYRPNGGRIELRATGPTLLLLAESIIKTCLARTGSEEQPIAATGMFSLNPAANLLYSEGMIQFRQGNINGSLPFFKRAGGAYDPNFFLARRQWAYCLIAKGELDQARSILEEMLLRRTELSSFVLIRIYKDLAKIYYTQYHRDAFQDLLAAAKPYAAKHDRSALLFFMQLEALHLAHTNKSGESKHAAADAAVLAGQHTDPESRIDHFWYQARLQIRNKQPKQALAAFDSALALARKHQLPSKQIGVLAYKIRILLSLGDLAGAENDLAVLESLSESAASDGNHMNRLKADFWLARAGAASGKGDSAWSHMRNIAREARDFGLLELELRANSYCIDALLRQNKIDEAERMLKRQKNRLHQIPPYFAYWTLNRLGILQFQSGRYRDALDTFDANLQTARDLGDHRTIAVVLNNKGEAHEKLGDFEAALQSFDQSLQLKLEQRDPSARQTLKRLVRVQPGDGRYLDRIRAYTHQLESVFPEAPKANE